MPLWKKSATIPRKWRKQFVIFICTFDLFQKDRYIYRFENLCIDEPDIALNDEAIKIFVNTKGTVGDVSEGFKELMYFLDTSEITEYTNPLVNEMANGLEKARSREEWRKDYMSLEMLKTECVAQGRAEGRAEERKSLLKQLINAGTITPEQAKQFA